MARDVARQVVVVLSFVCTLVVNALATTGALGGLTTQQIATRYPIYFLPANLTFGIWGVIYLALAVYSVYQALPAQREQPLQRRVGWLVALTGVFNSLWLVAFQNTLFAASMVAMLALLATLIVIYLRLEIGLRPISVAMRILVTLPFSLYLGWITVATIANASYVLYDAKWNGFGVAGATWAVIMLVIATGLTLFIVATRGDVAYLLVVVWAIVGIWIRQANTQQVAVAACLASFALAIGALYSLFTRTRRQDGTTPTAYAG
jgi:benzodiazapine receptor